MMKPIEFPVKFKEEAFDKVNSELRYGGIENALVRDLISADFVNILTITSRPSRTPLTDFNQNKLEPVGLRDCAYFWGGIFPESLQRTSLSQKDFANTLQIAYSHMGELYGPAIKRTSAILEAFHEAYQGFGEEEKRRLLH